MSSPLPSPVKTLAGWNAADVPFSAFVQLGDRVDDALAMSMLESLYPAHVDEVVGQVGEPTDHVNGRPVFATFVHREPAGWVFVGDCHYRCTRPPTEGRW